MAGTLLGAPVGAVTLPEQMAADIAADSVQIDAATRLQAPGLSALGLIPADVEALFVLARPDQNLAFIPHHDEDNPVYISQSMAVATGKGSSAVVKNFCAFVCLSNDIGMTHGALRLWADDAEDSALIDSARRSAEKALKAQIGELVKQTHLSPVYVVFSPAPGKETAMRELYESMMTRLTHDIDEDDERVSVAGFDGLKMSIGEDVRDGLEEELGITGLEDRCFYSLVKMQGDSMVMVLCEDPADISVPETPAQSVLATPKVAGAATHLPTLVSSAWLSAEMTDGLMKVSSTNSFANLARTVAKIFTDLGKKDEANKNVYAAAAAAATRVSEWKMIEYPTNTKPLTLDVWMKGRDVMAEITSDNLGIEYKPGVLFNPELATDDSTIFYAESTEVTKGYKLIQPGMLDDALAIVKGYVLSADEEERDDKAELLSQMEKHLPEANQLLDNLQKLDQALTFPVMFTVTAPESTANANGGMMVGTFPSVSIASGVKDRAALAPLWDSTLQVARSAMVKNGMPAESAEMVLSSLPVVSRPLAGGMMGYSVFHPFVAMAGMEPQLLVSDSSFVLSTKSSQGEKFAASRSGNGMPFAGVVASLQFAPIARSIQAAGGDSSDFREVADKVKGVYMVGTSTPDGTSILRVKVEMQPAASQDSAE